MGYFLSLEEIVVSTWRFIWAWLWLCCWLPVDQHLYTTYWLSVWPSEQSHGILVQTDSVRWVLSAWFGKYSMTDCYKWLPTNTNGKKKQNKKSKFENFQIFLWWKSINQSSELYKHASSTFLNHYNFDIFPHKILEITYSEEQIKLKSHRLLILAFFD